MALLSPPKLRPVRRTVAAGEVASSGGAHVPGLNPEDPSFCESSLADSSRRQAGSVSEGSGGLFSGLNRRVSAAKGKSRFAEPSLPLTGARKDARMALLVGIGSLVPVVGLSSGPVAVWYSWRALTKAHEARVFLEALAGFLLGSICTIAQWAFFLDVFAWAFVGR